MKIKLLLISFLFANVITAQITFQGCPAALGAQDFVLSATSTTTDAGVVRNTYESTPLNFGQSCPAGVCEIRIIWNSANTRWEIQLDNDGPVNTPNYTTGVLYFSTTASSPNPPDIASGTWQNAGSCPTTISTMNGDVDDGSTLSIEEVSEMENQIVIYPNPVNNFVHVVMESTPKRTTIYTMLGTEVLNTMAKKIDVSSLSQGMYLLQIETQEGKRITKKIVKQ